MRGRPPLPDSERKSARWAKRITNEEKDWLEEKLRQRRERIKAEGEIKMRKS